MFAAALIFAGAGAGTAAALATSGSDLIRAAGGAAGGVAGLSSAAWADTARQRRDATAAALEERGQALGQVITDPPQDRSALGLLLPTRHNAAPFRGRTADLAWLQAWLDNPDAHPAALVTGPAGTGKTRLITQFAATRPPPWTAGWLQPGHGASALAAVRACGDPALILIDNADTNSDTTALLTALASHPHGPQVRVLLTTRTTEALTQIARQLPAQARWILAPANLRPRTIGPFGSIDDHARWFAEATRAYAAALSTPPPELPALIATGTANAAEPVLTIQAQALLAVLETQRRRPQHPDAQALPFDQVAAALFEHEQDRWQQAAQQPRSGLAVLDTPVQQHVIAALMLSRADTEPDAITALQTIPDLTGATAERLARIARGAFGLYPPAPVRIQPDMLAEWFLITQLTTAPDLAAHLDDLTGHHTPALLTLLAHASDHMPAAIPLYARLIHTDPAGLAAAAADAALTARTAQPLLDAALADLITSTHWTPDTLDGIDHHLPEGTLPRTRAALSAATVDNTRQTGIRDDLACALLRHANSLRDLGRHQETLAAVAEALALRRDLASVNPAHQPELAMELNNYGLSLRDLGRHREALAAVAEALALRRDLAAANPSHQPDLATTLDSYGLSLGNLGQHQEALAAEEEALGLYRDLAAADPSHQRDLAMTLNNCGVSLHGLGQYGEALAAFEEALALYRDLAAVNPARRPLLADTLNNSGLSLWELGRPREALATVAEALALWRDLAAISPAHQPGLARALTGYGISLRDLGRHQEALAAFEEVLTLWRDLAVNPAHQPGLANILNSYGASLRDLGRHQEALTAFAEALALCRALASVNPAHQPDLAMELNNYGLSLRDLGRHREAVTYHMEALDLYAILARNDPDLYEKTYQYHLAELRRTYDLHGDHSTGISLHLSRDTRTATSDDSLIDESAHERNAPHPSME